MIQIDQLSVRLGRFELHDVSFHVDAQQYGVLMGKTGSGKTTLLECICGLRPVHSGRILLAEQDVTHLKPAERGIGYVPQDLALFPTMTVQQHLEFPLHIRRWPVAKQRQRSAELADLLGIGPLLDRRPAGLSGGESQRVALGRALSFAPPVLLLDEPLSALDEDTRQQMYALLERVQEHTHVTVLHITHSSSEANRLADVRLQMTAGVVTRLVGEVL
ncbi:MAG: ATP-binding cassette domain-containing protein [Planctomycetales bacterium]|nr:ATP-binding cassette domain-containing protein [Planctomycetales bacterium]